MEEIWKPIIKFNCEYEISNHGRIRSIQKKILKSNGVAYTRQSKILKPAQSKDGYLRGSVSVMNNLKPYVVHRLVCECFHLNPSNKETVNHINGIKTDNKAINLEWNTRSENCQHSFDTGLQKPKRGELNGMAKLSREQVIAMRKQKNEGGRYWGRNDLAKHLKINVKHIQRIVNDYTLWPDV